MLLSSAVRQSSYGLIRTLYQRPSAMLVVWGYVVQPAMQRLSFKHYVLSSPFYVAQGYAAMWSMRGGVGGGSLLVQCCAYELGACCLVAMLDWRMRRHFRALCA